MEISEGAYTLAGVVVGSTLTQIFSWWSVRQADRRTISEALFFLLELHRLLSTLERWNRLNPDLVVLLRQYATTPQPTMEAVDNEQLGQWLRALVAPLVGPQLAALKAGYDAGLLKLATIDPISAHRLRGQDELLQRVPQVLEAVQTVSATHLNLEQPLPGSISQFFQQHVVADNIVDTLNLVREVMQELAAQLTKATQQKLAEELAREREHEQQALGKWKEFMSKARAAFGSPTGQG